MSDALECAFFSRSDWNQVLAGRAWISLECSTRFSAFVASISARRKCFSAFSSYSTSLIWSAMPSILAWNSSTAFWGSARATSFDPRLATALTSLRSLSSMKVTAVPFLPARAVLPTLCK